MIRNSGFTGQMKSPENIIENQLNYPNSNNQTDCERNDSNGPTQIDGLIEKLEKLDISFRRRFAALCLEKIQSNKEEKYLQYCAYQIKKEQHYIQTRQKIIKSERVYQVLLKFERDRLKQNSNLAKYYKRKSLIESIATTLRTENIDFWNLLVKATQFPHLLKIPKSSPLMVQKIRRLEQAIFYPIQYKTVRFLYRQELLIERKIRFESAKNGAEYSNLGQTRKRVTRSNTKEKGLVGLVSESSEDSESSEWDSKQSDAMVKIINKVGYDWGFVSQCPKLKDKTPLSCKRRFLRLYKRNQKNNLRKMFSDRNSKKERNYDDKNFIVDENEIETKKPIDERKKRKLLKTSETDSETEISDSVESESSGVKYRLNKNFSFGERKSVRLLGVEKINYFEERTELNPKTSPQEKCRFLIETMLAKREIVLPVQTFETENARIVNEAGIGDLAEQPPPFADFAGDVKIGGHCGDEQDLCKIEQFLVKISGKCYRKCLWLTRDQLNHFFGYASTNSRITHFNKRRVELEINNRRLWGPDVHFNPQYLKIDRLLSKSQKTGEILYLTAWRGGISITEATWEPERLIGGDNIKRFEEYHSDANPAAPISAGKRLFIKSDCLQNKETLLHKYQVEGVNWLLANYYQNKNCILADEMGLGKTLQTIIFLSFLKDNFVNMGPFLVVAPLSTLSQWRREFENWSDLKTCVYYDPKGGKKSRDKIRKYEFFRKNSPQCKFDALITSYEIAFGDAKELSEAGFKLLVVDEGHRLKNIETKLTAALESFGVERKLLLTGTPIQNNMFELWTLMNFLNPKEFPVCDDLQKNMTSLTSSETLHRLQKQINPFILRRFKEDVQKSIPPKQETIIDIELTTLQKKYYRAIYEKNREFLSSPESNKSNSLRLVNIEIQLRKCCNHPFLIRSVEEQEVPVECTWEEYFKKCISASGKMVFLDKLLPKLKEEGHKVLIFSQMHGVLDILQDFFRFKNYRFERIDGNIVGPERQNAIDRFCDKDSDHFAFLLSTRAGGVGLNLAAADTAILFDSDWNPQLDLQAQARCHRIGQDRPVMVYRLVTKNTYESQMFQRASVKLGLDKAFAIHLNEDSDGKIPEKDRQNLEEMLRYGAYRFLNENDDEAKKFCEKDIEELLKTNSHVLTHHMDPGGNHKNLIKMRFESDLADSSLDVTADNFWDKVLKSDQRKKSLESEIKALFSQLTKGEPSTRATSFFRQIEGAIEKFHRLKKPSDNCKNTLQKFLEYLESLQDIFSPKQSRAIQKWAKEAVFPPKNNKTPPRKPGQKLKRNAAIIKKADQKTDQRPRQKTDLKPSQKPDQKTSHKTVQTAGQKTSQKTDQNFFRKTGQMGTKPIDCFVCVVLKPRLKKRATPSKTGLHSESGDAVHCDVKDCGTEIHEDCQNALKARFPRFYSARKGFRCPLHFCSACFQTKRGQPLVSCVVCLKSFHAECLPKGFGVLGDKKVDGFCAACDRKIK